MGKIHCKYYTSIEKMEAVKPLMNIDNCKSVIDLSAGCGDMIIPLLDILSEDIDVTAVDICWEQNNKNDLEKKYSIKCIEEDSMKWFINNEKKYDLVLSNPPFNAPHFVCPRTTISLEPATFVPNSIDPKIS